MSESQNLWHSAQAESNEASTDSQNDSSEVPGYGESKSHDEMAYLVQQFEDLKVFKANNIFIPIIIDTSHSDIFIGHVKTFSGNFEYFTIEDIYCPDTKEIRTGRTEHDTDHNRVAAFQRLWSVLRGSEYSVSAAQRILLGKLSWEVKYLISKINYRDNSGSHGYLLSELVSLPDFFHKHNPPIEFQVALTGALSRELCLKVNSLFLN